MAAPRILFLLLFALLPVLACGRGGGSRGGRRGSRQGGRRHGSSQHTYPSGGDLSGNSQPKHNYPHSDTGLSGNNPSQYKKLHHHYHPPQQVYYGYGHHPVYRGTPPGYVFTYRNSGSRYNALLTGLALYNLGRMSGHHDNYYYYSQAKWYKSRPGENCELQIINTYGDYESAKIDCQLMSSFILDSERENDQNRNRVQWNTNTDTTINGTEEHSGDYDDDDESSTVVTTEQNSTVVDALQAQGPPIQVTPGMDCYMVRYYRDSSIKRKVDCGLLKQYAASSFRSDSTRNVPLMNIVILLCLFQYLEN